MNTDEFSLPQLQGLMTAHGAARLFAKKLAANDNSKNQPYFGGDFSVLNILPAGKPVAALAAGGEKKTIFKAPLRFAWLSDDGNAYPAPNAKLILYPQYPEVRFSGYLDGADRQHRPSALMGTTRVAGRVLFLGVRNDGSILGFAAGPDSRLAKELAQLRDAEVVGVFLRIPFGPADDAAANRTALLAELCRIASRDWINSRRLDQNGKDCPCSSPNCGGYTLEAELGIRPNGFANPDFRGWEVKQHSVGSFAKPTNNHVTLMTPEPSDGVYVSEGVVRFCERWGYADMRGRTNRINFGGSYRVDARVARTRITLRLLGYDAARGRITDASGGIALVDDAGVEAAVWRYADLIDHWKRKHASAAYVPSEKRESPERQYRYSPMVRLGTGTSFEKFLDALASHHMVYDPGIKVENYPEAPITKRRSQFRMKSQDLRCLYDAMETISACDPSAPG